MATHGKIITLRLKEPLANLLEKAAKRKKKQVSELIRGALSWYLADLESEIPPHPLKIKGELLSEFVVRERHSKY